MTADQDQAVLNRRIDELMARLRQPEVSYAIVGDKLAVHVTSRLDKGIISSRSVVNAGGRLPTGPNVIEQAVYREVGRQMELERIVRAVNAIGWPLDRLVFISRRLQRCRVERIMMTYTISSRAYYTSLRRAERQFGRLYDL